MPKIMPILIYVLLVLLVLPSTTRGHSEGASWSEKVGEYTVDVGYEPASIKSSMPARFDFALWKDDEATGMQADYDHVWVRIIYDKETFLATGIARQEVGPTTLLYTFDASGSYSLETSFRDKEGNDIAVANFPITVAGRADSQEYPLLILAALLGAGAIYGYKRYKNVTRVSLPS